MELKLNWERWVTDAEFDQFLKDKKKLRECLRCEEKFESDNRANRICKHCSNLEQNIFYESKACYHDLKKNDDFEFFGDL